MPVKPPSKFYRWRLLAGHAPDLESEEADTASEVSKELQWLRKAQEILGDALPGMGAYQQTMVYSRRSSNFDFRGMLVAVALERDQVYFRRICWAVLYL